MPEHEMLVRFTFMTSWGTRVQFGLLPLNVVPLRIPTIGEQVFFGEVACKVEMVGFDFIITESQATIGYTLAVVIRCDPSVSSDHEVACLIADHAKLIEYLGRASNHGHVVIDDLPDQLDVKGLGSPPIVTD